MNEKMLRFDIKIRKITFTVPLSPKNLHGSLSGFGENLPPPASKSLQLRPPLTVIMSK